jgi:hypothetical protein
MSEQDKNYQVVVTIDEMKEQSAEACAFVAQGTTYRFKQNDWRKDNGKPNLATKFRVGSHVRLTCHDFSPEGKDWTQHWIDHAEKVGDNVPNTKADRPASKRDNYKSGSKKSDFDPTLSARQTAAHVAGVLATLTPHENASEATLCAIFEVYADCVANWLNKRDMVGEAQSTLGAVVIPDDIDPDYEEAKAAHDSLLDDDDIPFD